MLKKIIQNSALLEAQINTFLEDTTEPLPPDRVMENPNFRKWFGNSVTVTSDGTPMVFYHGATEEFYTFDASKPGAGVFNFSTSQDFAQRYADAKSQQMELETEIKVMPVYLKTVNPFNPFKDVNKIDIPEEINIRFKYGVAGFMPPVKFKRERIIDLMQGRDIEDSPVQGKTSKDFQERDTTIIDGDRVYIIIVDNIGIKYMPLHSWLPKLTDEENHQLRNAALNNEKEFSFERPYNSGFKTYTAYIKTALFIPDKVEGLDNWDILESPDVVKIIKDAGFDAVYTQEKKVVNIFVFSPNQIKSIYNNGQFSTTSDNISEEYQNG